MQEQLNQRIVQEQVATLIQNVKDATLDQEQKLAAGTGDSRWSYKELQSDL